TSTLNVLRPNQYHWYVLPAVKPDPDLRDIPVIMITGLKERGLAFSLGASDFMTKPVDRASLKSMLRRYVPCDTQAPVLLVEDDPASRAATRRVVTRPGLNIEECENGREALDWLERHPSVALIMLDIVMRGMDGCGVLKEVR